MKNENTKKLIDLIKADENVMSQLKALCEIEDAALVESKFKEFSVKYDCECSLPDFMDAQKLYACELSEEQLAAVEGGKVWCFLIGGSSKTEVARDASGGAACMYIGFGFHSEK